MSLGEQPAFPTQATFNEKGEAIAVLAGMTYRQWLAGLAMGHLIERWNEGGKTHSQMVATQAVDYADALIKELEK